MSSETLFVVVDGSSYLYRAFHALPPLHNSKGLPTGAVYGVINMLRKLINDYPTEHFAVVFDAKGKTFRDDLYQEYKANRPAMPDDLQLQIEPLHDIIHAMGIPLLMIEGCEADDVIGTLCQQAVAQNMKCIISTGDKDLAQLVNPDIKLINTMTNTVLDEEGVKQKFGIPPKLIVDYLTLVGDSVDNVPGVEKVGPKTAVKWLEQYGSLANITERAEEFPGKIGENLRKALSFLPLSKQLVTIRCDIELPMSISNIKKQNADKEKLMVLYKELEFKSWLSELLSNQTETQTFEKHYQTITTQQQLEEWKHKLSSADLIALDTETNSLNVMSADLVGLSFSIKDHEAIYIPVAHDPEIAAQQLSRADVLEQLKLILENPTLKKVGHNLKYDINVLANHGIHLDGVCYDTLLESYVLQSVSRHDMDSLSLKYLGYKTITFEEVAGKGVHQVTFDKIPLKEATDYAAEDADVTLQLHEKLWPQVNEIAGVQKVFSNIEMPLVMVLARMERAGVLIDDALLKQQSSELGERILQLEKEAFSMAGQEFNLNSPKQLQEIFFEKMQFPIIEKTPTGQASTAENVLQELAHSFDLPKIILEFRSLTKLKTTYTDRLPEQINPKTNRVHTSYNQAGTSTGRLSSSDPNLQNIPVRTVEGRKIRQAFIAPPQFKIVSADYSQIELRIMAHLSQDQGLLDAFANNLDIHKATAAEIFGMKLNEVTSEQRRRAKAINFGLIYGMSSFGLAKQIGVDRHIAQEYIDLYFSRYPGVKHYMERTRQFAHHHGFVETLYGRRMYLSEINSRNIQRQKAAERAAINAPLQGTAADIIKIAMIEIDAWLQQEKMAARMLMQVHDELVFEVQQSLVDDFMVVLKKYMCDTFATSLHVPILVDIGVGDNWGQAHD